MNKTQELFLYRNIIVSRQVKAVTPILSGYAFIWWIDFERTREKAAKVPFTAWNHVKVSMWKKFVPENQEKYIFHKLHAYTMIIL